MRKLAIKRKDRDHVYAEFNHTCVACWIHCPNTKDGKVYYGISYVLRHGIPTPKHVRLTIDHFLPVALGGKYHRKNYVTLCENCNINKADKDPLVWAMSLDNLPAICCA